MEEGLLDKIRTHGHWRINLRPRQERVRPLTLGDCIEYVEKSAVSLRGWDFPHINRRNDENGGIDRYGSYVENWTDWWGFYEFWRMYKSGQFLSYMALREDTKADEYGILVPSLNIVNTIYSVTEFMEFANRLSDRGTFGSYIEIDISLIGTRDRVLSVGRNRMPFFDRKTTNATSLNFNQKFSVSEFSIRYKDIALDIALDFFDAFGWNPERQQIAADQEKFYRREFSD